MTPVGMLVPSDDANDSAEEIIELTSVVALPKAEVASLATEEATEVAAEMMELTAEGMSD